jgi:hypothetical protein
VTATPRYVRVRTAAGNWSTGTHPLTRTPGWPHSGPQPASPHIADCHLVARPACLRQRAGLGAPPGAATRRQSFAREQGPDLTGAGPLLNEPTSGAGAGHRFRRKGRRRVSPFVGSSTDGRESASDGACSHWERWRRHRARRHRATPLRSRPAAARGRCDREFGLPSEHDCSHARRAARVARERLQRQRALRGCSSVQAVRRSAPGDPPLANTGRCRGTGSGPALRLRQASVACRS